MRLRVYYYQKVKTWIEQFSPNSLFNISTCKCKFDSTDDMSKMHYFSNKFSKITKALGAFRPRRPLTFNIGDLKFRNLAK